MRVARYVLALMLLAMGGHAAAQVGPRFLPPDEWAAYFEAARKADVIVDDEQRCLAYPDMPGNAWHAGTVQARCALLRKPRYSLQQIQQLLAEPEGAATLEQHFRSLLDAHYRDLGQREQIYVALDIFDGKVLARQVAERWTEVSPGSAFARVASGRQYVQTAWDARGSRLARWTPDENFRRMHEFFALARSELDKAFAAEPRLVPACQAMMMVAQVESDEALAEQALSRCLKLDESDYYVLQRWQWMRQPKWGGSLEVLSQIDAYVAARVDKVPLLGVLLGSQVLYAAHVPAFDGGDWEAALPKLEAAVRLAPEAFYLRWTGDAARRIGDRWKALAYLSQALRFNPRDENARSQRAMTRISLGDFGNAVVDAEAALGEEPANGYFAYQLGEAHTHLFNTDAARAAFRIVRDDARTHESGLARWCWTFFSRPEDFPQAEACTATLVKEFPSSGDAWFMRLSILEKLHDKRASDAASEFLKYADMDNPDHESTVDRLRSDPARGIKP